MIAATPTLPIPTRPHDSTRRPAGASPATRVTTPAEEELMQAMLAYKQSSGRMFPTWSEVLEVLVDLGYRKVADGNEATA